MDECRALVGRGDLEFDIRVREAICVALKIQLQREPLREADAFSAAQKLRLANKEAFAELPGELIERADELAAHARAGRLALFLGAGASRAAGLPLWRELLEKLARRADIVLESFRPDVKHRLGVDYETLRRLNPRIICGSISGFGQTGPDASRPGVDQIIQGMSGLMSVTGLPGHGPLRVGIPVADLCGGIFAAYGVAVALLERDQSGKGQWVQTSLLPTLHGEQQSFRDTTLIQTGRTLGDGWSHRGVRTDRYLYGTDGEDGFLYDRLLDPDEMVNLIDDPAYAAVRDALELRRTELVTCAGWTCNQRFGPLPEPVADTTR